MAPHVGTTGHVVGLDLNARRLVVARALPPPPGAVIEWREGDALALPCAETVFDLVCCQQGVQFFPDRLAALREMYRVLVPGGRLALNVWRAIEHNPVALAMAEALGRHVGPKAAAWRHGPFALGNAEALRALVVGAGFREVIIGPRDPWQGRRRRARFPVGTTHERDSVLTTRVNRPPVDCITGSSGLA